MLGFLREIRTQLVSISHSTSLTLRPSAQPLITMLIHHKPIPHNEPSVQTSSSVVVKIRQGFVGQLFLFTATLMCPKVISLYYLAFHAGCTDYSLFGLSRLMLVRQLLGIQLIKSSSSGNYALPIHRGPHVQPEKHFKSLSLSLFF